jgi:FkbM family methyltransferase
MESLPKALKRKWGFLKSQYGFRKAPMRVGIYLVLWLFRCSLRKAVFLNLRKWNVRMYLPAQWRGFGKYVFAFRENYERELVYLEKLLAPGSTFVDVGANMGIYTMVASRLVGEAGRVIAFEPSAQSFPLLRKNIALNGLTNVLAFPEALSHEIGRTKLYHGPDPVSNSLGRGLSWDEDAEEVTTETLDSVLHRTSLRRVDAIKIDVEGAEELVLRGALKTLTCMRPVIIFEINPGACSSLGLSPYGATELLQSLGYNCFVVGQSGPDFRLDSPPGYFNVLAIPSNWNGNLEGLTPILSTGVSVNPERLDISERSDTRQPETSFKNI